MTDTDKAEELIARALMNAQLIALERCASGIPAARSLNLPRDIQEEAAALLAKIAPLMVAQAVAAETMELRRQLGGGCEANDGQEHLAIKQGNYAFCGKCGESLRGVRYCHMMPQQSAAAIRATAPAATEGKG